LIGKSEPGRGEEQSEPDCRAAKRIFHAVKLKT
jgi:hypothetical protein